MTQQNDLTAEALRRGAVPGRGYNIARVISQVFHPVLLSIASIVVIGVLGSASVVSGLAWAALCTILLVVPPTIFFGIRLRQGAYTDDDISERHQRNELYFFGLGTLAFGILVLSLAGAPTPFLALLTSALLINILSWIINFFWKISVHSAGIGSFATVSTLYSEPLGLIVWICALILGWARVRTRNHTPMQVVAGLALSCACVIAAFMAFGLL